MSPVDPTASPTPSATATSILATAIPVDPSPEAFKRLSLEQLMNLDVTSVAKAPEPWGQAPAAIDVITNDEIRRSGARTLPEALRLADNLDVAQKDSHDWAISARGFDTDSSNKLLVLMDGRSVYTPLFSGVFWDVQDYLLEDIDRIEVISGPGGTLWGANAVNGVINITTKSAKDTQGTYWETSGGSRFQDSLAVRYGGQAALGLYYRVYAKYFDLGDEDLASGGEASDAWNHKQGGFRMDGESGADHFTLQGDIYGTTAQISSGGTAESDGGNLLGRWTKTFAADDDMGLQAYYDRTYLYDPVPASVSSGGTTLAPAGTLTDNLTTLDLDFHHRFALTGSHELTWGLGARYTHDTVMDAPGLAFDPSTLDQGLFSVFAQDQAALFPDLTLTAGTKLEHNDYTGFEWEPSVRLRWDLAKDQMLWTAVSRAVRAPSRVDRDILLPTPDFSPIVDDLLVGGSDFRSETLVAYELGYRSQLEADLSGSASAFFNNYDDIRSTSLSPPNAYSLPFPLYYANNLAAQTWGVELTSDWQAAPGLRLHLGYDLLEESVWVKPGQYDYNNALNETADPRNQVFVRPSLDLPGGLSLDPAFRFVDSLTYNADGTARTVPSYAELDLRLGWKANGLFELSVTGRNLLHDHHAEYVIASPNPAEDITRSVYGEIQCRF